MLILSVMIMMMVIKIMYDDDDVSYNDPNDNGGSHMLCVMMVK